jgi:hypothetical protein
MNIPGSFNELVRSVIDSEDESAPARWTQRAQDDEASVPTAPSSFNALSRGIFDSEDESAPASKTGNAKNQAHCGA